MGIGYGKQIPADGWVKVFRHYSGNEVFFSSADSWAEAKLSNPTNPYAEKFSILERIDGMTIDGEYIFKLYYPVSGQTQIWAQQNNPVTDIVASGGVIGYRPISIETTSNGWGGLEYSGASTFLDGTVNISNWYYAIAPAVSWSTATTFPGDSVAVNEVELWVKIR